MQRSITNSILRLFKTSLAQTSRRAFSTTTRATKANGKWIAPATIMSIGLATYLLSSPLSLETKATKESTKPSTETAKPSKTEQSEEKKAEAATEEQQPEAAVAGEGEEQPQQSAYNPETGEINWDCPCLGGMAHGPCGEEFKEAFSCFVYSEADPKGFDCIEKFKNMQNCFRKYPDVYSEEIRDDEGPVDALEVEQEHVPVQDHQIAAPSVIEEETTTPVVLSATPVVDVVEVFETTEIVESLPIAEE